VLQQEQVKVEAELSGEFQFVARATDSLLQVNSSDGRFLVLTELQFRYDKKMPERLAVYASLARHKYEQPVYVTVVYFMPPAAGTAIADAFHQEFMGQVARQDFQPILLWELEAEQVLAYNNPALLPFVPLMQGGDTEQMVRRCATRIRQEPQAAELETILALFAGYVLDTALIKQILRWEMAVVQESPIIRELREEWLAKGREEGREEGLEEGIELGERKATIEALRQILTIRFNVEVLQLEAGKFDKQFERLDVTSLKKLHEVALTVQSLAEFERALAGMRQD
jgi:predicted transposase YdaD